MLKPFIELINADFKPHSRPAKGENIEYLPWSVCLRLLYENGAERVDFHPVPTEDGSFIHSSREQAFFVKVQVEIDDKSYTIDYPIIEGMYSIQLEKIDQAKINKAVQRAFVKCVAIHTGLGLTLWEKTEDDEEEKGAHDTLEWHSPALSKKFIEETMSRLVQKGKSVDEVLSEVKVAKKSYDTVLDCLEKAQFLKERLMRLDKKQ